MAEPRAPLDGPAAPLPQRVSVARYCLLGSTPFALYTFLVSSQAVKDAPAKAVLLILAFAAPVVLVYVALRVPADHDAVAAPSGARCAGRWDWTDVAAFLPVAAGAAVLTASLLLGLTQALDTGLGQSARTAVESFAGQAASYSAAIAALVVLVLLRRGLPLSALGLRLPRRLGRAGWLPWLLIAVAGAFVALYVAEWLGSLSTHVLPNSPNTQCTSVRDQYGGYVAVAIPLVCIIAPIAEETVFRGFIYGWLRRRLQVLPAVLLSGAIFSAAHVVLVLALPLFGVGVILALLYEYSDSLLPGAIVHGLFNLVGIIAILGTTVTC